MNFIDLFAGIGGIRSGFEANGFNCIGFCEIDKSASNTYKNIYDTTNEVEWGDIHKITDETFASYKGKTYAIVGGSPCQAFSISGKRLGFSDKKGEVFFEYIRALKIIQPDVFVFENVLGLLSHLTDSTLERVLPMLENDCAFIPNQKEGEVFYHNLAIYKDQDLGKSELLDNYLKIEKVIKRLKKKKGRGSYLERTFNIVLQEFSKVGYDIEWDVLQSSDFGVKQHRERLYVIGHLRGRSTRKVFPIPEEVRNNFRFEQQKASKLPYTVYPVSSVGYLSKSQNGSRIKIKNASMFTLTASGNHGVLQKYPDNTVKMRKLTPRECWRLQGFTDEQFNKAKEVTSDSQLYKQAGNSVTVNVIKCIAYQLKNGELFDNVYA